MGNRNTIHDACSFGNVDVVKQIIMNGANINEKNHFGDTPLQFFCKTKKRYFNLRLK